MKMLSLLKKITFASFIVSVMMSGAELRASTVRSLEVQLKKMIKLELAKAYPEAQVEVYGHPRWLTDRSIESPRRVTLLGDDSKGHIHFSVQGENFSNDAEGWFSFSAWTMGRVATKRIRPGEVLDVGSFVEQKIDVAVGSAREYRGVILPATVPTSKLESLQTILEGQFLTSTAVRRIPDVRRGDPLQVQIESSGLLIRTSGVAEEPSYVGRTIRVQTLRAKRELTGQLLEGGVVEVRI